MRVGLIIIVYSKGLKKTKESMADLMSEIQSLKLNNCSIYLIDNSKDNRGYAYGVNQGIRRALKDKKDLVIVANPDISLKNLIGRDLFVAAKHFDLWGLAMRQQGRVYYGGEIDRWRMSGGLINKKPLKRFNEVDFVAGSLMFIKRRVIDKIGFFDESYFMYYEDVDYCYRARRKGFRVGVDSGLNYFHFEESKTNKNKKDWLAKSRWKFFLKYSNWGQKIHELLRLPKTIIGR